MNHKLNEAMDHVSDAFIADAAAQVNKARGAVIPMKPRPWLGAVAAVLVIVLIGALMFPVLNALDTSGGSKPPILQAPTTIVPTISPDAPTTVPSDVPTTAPTSGSTTVPTTRPTTRPTTIPTSDGVGDPCGKGHSYLNGFCVYCAAQDPNYNPCANGHEFHNGYCVWCLAADPNYASTQPTTAPPITNPTTKPGTASLTTDKSVYFVDELIHFTISSTSSNGELRLERVDGDWKKTYYNVGTSFSISFGWAGEYKATFMGLHVTNPATIYFTVVEDDSGLTPTYATITADKSVYSFGEPVNFSISSDGTLNTLWVYKPDGTYVYFNDAGTSFSYTPTQAGTYYALVETGIGTACLTSEKISFQVSAPDYDPCANGHTYENGYCVYCGTVDLSLCSHMYSNGYCIYCNAQYNPCANGHAYKNGFCVHCFKKDPNYNPCDNGQHNYYNGYCLRCLKADPDYDHCAFGHNYSNGACIRCGSPAPDIGDTSTLEEEYGATLKIMIPSHNAKDTNAWQNIVVSQFKTLYPNVTVQFVTADWSTWYEKLMVHYTTGDPIDLIYDGVNNEPKFALSGITQPLQNYINMDNPNLKKSVMDECFQYSGNYYVAATEVNYGVIYYNKDMFEAAGLDDPMELYRKGEWNWTTFVRLAKRLTNKNAGIYGFSTNFPYLFYGSNATSTLKLDANGRYSLNLNDPAFIAALSIIQDGEYDSGWSGFDTVYYAMDSFQTGKTAMLGTFSVYESNINDLANIGAWPPINYGVVPMPYGPSNPTGKNMIISNGWAIGADSDCPAHVGKLIDMLVDGQAAYLAQQSAKLPAASVELYQEMSKNVFCVNTRDSAIDGGNELIQAVAAGKSIAQAIAEYTPQYLAMIEPYAAVAQNQNN